MFVDARELEADAVLDADICIVGAGPAGITLAREMLGRRYNVVMLESGGIEFDEGQQPLGQAGEMSVVASTRPVPVKALRTRRQFGGNANAWSVRTEFNTNGVRLTRLSANDFEQRDWVRNSGWPIGLADLAAHYERAQNAFQLQPGSYDPDDWEDTSARRLPIPGEALETAVFQFGSGVTFRSLYRRQLEHAANIRVYHHATAVEVETDAEATIATGVRAASNPGRHFRVRAQCVVLAGGAMTCAQLLLMSDRVKPEGLGNRHDLVGRYFMDHPILRGGDFIPNSRRLFEAMTLYDLRTVRGVPVMGHLQIGEAALRREGLLQLSMLMFPREGTEVVLREMSERQERGVQAARRARSALKGHKAPVLGDVMQSLRGLDGLAIRAFNRTPHAGADLGRGGWSRRIAPDHNYKLLETIQQAEQPPHWDNRVYLSDKRDALGCRRISVDWRWHDEDMLNTMRGQDLYAATFKQAGLGTFEALRLDEKPAMRSLSTSHYIGMTRMHSDPRQGVVDAQCEVHGVRNLFVASGSVFTTGGFANPTLTIVCLALRIGDLIKRRVGGAVEAGTADARASTAA